MRPTRQAGISQYTVHGEFTRGQRAESVLLVGFSVDVTALFGAAEDVPE